MFMKKRKKNIFQNVAFSKTVFSDVAICTLKFDEFLSEFRDTSQKIQITFKRAEI